jgi:hypothetical protein
MSAASNAALRMYARTVAATLSMSTRLRRGDWVRSAGDPDALVIAGRFGETLTADMSAPGQRVTRVRDASRRD